MRKIFYLLCFLSGSTLSFAQITEGVIIYERKINMHKRIQDEQMRAMIPEFRTSKHQLMFSDSSCVYKIVPEDEMPEAFSNEGGGQRFVMRMGPGDNGELYKNFAEGKSIETRDLGAKTYIIEDTIKNRSWKLTGETKTILGYTCRKAISTETMMTGGTVRMVVGGPNTSADTTNRPKPTPVIVEAWYAEGITAPVGPESYGMLPGVILELNIDNGSMIYTALEVKKEVSKKDIKEPKKGKRVTRAEFFKMQSELMGSGGGNRIIRM